MPKFFIPNVEAAQAEEAYAALAAAAGAAPPAIGFRIYEIQFRHDGILWTARIGEPLRGTKNVVTGRGRAKRYRDIPQYSDSTPLAIFEGNPFVILHDQSDRSWNNPIYAGSIYSVRRFEP